MNEFNTQICTSIEQSKRLLELGLNPYTSDMCWLSTSDVPLSIGYIDLEKVSEELKFNIIPAWSLHRLIELYSDVEDTSSLCIKNVSYKLLIFCIEKAIHCKLFNKEYLKQ